MSPKIAEHDHDRAERARHLDGLEPVDERVERIREKEREEERDEDAAEHVREEDDDDDPQEEHQPAGARRARHSGEGALGSSIIVRDSIRPGIRSGGHPRALASARRCEGRAMRSRADAPPDELPRFDEDEPRPVPPLARQDGATLPRLVAVMRRLLAPDGCPWDREQTFESLRRYVLEEACEVIDAIDGGDRKALREELGDLLLQVVFQAELGRREGTFAIDDVVSGIVEKLVHRHPHVFGDMEAKDADEVLANWEKLKAIEKKGRGLLGGVPRSLPALIRAQRVGEKVARVGFDWEDARGSRAKVTEELGELDEAIAAKDPRAIEEELGDTLFALVNLARHVEVDAEGALRRTIDKFTRRFAHVEKRVLENHGGWGTPGEGGGTNLPLATLDAYWEEAKRERAEAVDRAPPARRQGRGRRFARCARSRPTFRAP